LPPQTLDQDRDAETERLPHQFSVIYEKRPLFVAALTTTLLYSLENCGLKTVT